MSLFDQVVSLASGALGNDAAQSGLLGNLTQMLGGSQGGISNLLGAFQQHGLGDIVQSWIGTGANLPISAEQIQQVLGNGALQQLAEGTGLGSTEIAGQLSSLLPNLVDKLTPEGSVPSEGFDLGNIANTVKGLFS